MASLLACPFCRELYARGEASECPECGVELRNLESLPPSPEALEEEAARGEVLAPDERPRSWKDFSRGRGLLIAVALLGLASFFAPWVAMTRPELTTFSGFDLARGRAGWLWGGAVAWFITVPLVFTRLSVAKLRGVRLICALFAAMTLGEVLVMMANPPSGKGYVSVAFDWAWGIYTSGALGLIGVLVSLRLGGRAETVVVHSFVDGSAAEPESAEKSDGGTAESKAPGRLLH